ncbi:MAG: tetratricopeptide repeat protein [Ignavibacteria bacterium]
MAPQHANALNCLGLAFQKQARLDDAIDCYSRAVAASPQFAIAHYNLGFLLRLRGRHSDALVSLQKAAVLQPSLAEAHYELGNLYSDQGRQAEAAEHYEKVVALWPDHADARNNLGLTFLRRDMLDEAAACFEEAIRLKPQSMAAHNNLGDIRHKQGRLNEALACADTAIGLAPEVAGLYITKGIVLQDMGRFDEAEACYARAQALEPEVRTWQFNHALLLLLRGRLAEGWKQYESRFYPGSPARAIGFPQPQWAGESLEGKSLLIWEDQGIGDEILFASQFAELAARAGRCVIECAPKLVSLFARSFPGAQVVPRTSPPHRAMQEGIDFQISAGSLARWLRPTIEAFPRQQGYLLPDAERLAHWKKRLAELGPDLKVGICWRSKLRGGLRHLHYTALDDWGPILTVPGVRFVNLQYDDCAAEIAAAKRRFGISVQVFEEVDLFDDLDEAAALIGALDLVVTAPTAVSRLAAAQGIPTWEMSYGHSWVSLGTNHVPWLPAHRQHARRWDQPWSEIIAAIGDDLKLAAAQRAE